MDGITSNWVPTDTDASVTQVVGSGKVHQREEEFRSALANYMAGYIADQQRRGTAESVARSSYFAAVVRRFAGWMRHGRRSHGPRPTER